MKTRPKNVTPNFPKKPVYILGTGESVETRLISQLKSYTSSRAFRVSSQKAFAESGIKHGEVDHLMIYDAFAHLPIWRLEDLGFCQGVGGMFAAAGTIVFTNQDP